jgi:hypothetical protein
VPPCPSISSLTHCLPFGFHLNFLLSHFGVTIAGSFIYRLLMLEWLVLMFSSMYPHSFPDITKASRKIYILMMLKFLSPAHKSKWLIYFTVWLSNM